MVMVYSSYKNKSCIVKWQFRPLAFLMDLELHVAAGLVLSFEIFTYSYSTGLLQIPVWFTDEFSVSNQL